MRTERKRKVNPVVKMKESTDSEGLKQMMEEIGKGDIINMSDDESSEEAKN